MISCYQEGGVYVETLALIIAIIFFVAGLIGTVLPLLPGGILVLGGMLIYGLMTQFVTLDAYFYLFQALALVMIFAIDYIASAIGTRKFGGSKQAAWGAIIGTIFGLFFGPLGIVIGPFLGAVTAELLRGMDINQAIRVGFGTLIGVLGGTILKIGAEILMMVYFFMRIF